jgi:hypothetical protein
MGRLRVAKTDYLCNVDGIQRGYATTLTPISPQAGMLTEQKPILILGKKSFTPFDRSVTRADDPLVVPLQSALRAAFEKQSPGDNAQRHLDDVAECLIPSLKTYNHNTYYHSLTFRQLG